MTRATDWLAGLRLAPERLLGGDGTDSGQPGPTRLLSLLLVAPFVLASMVAQAAMAASGPALALAAVCAAFAVSWLLGLLVIERTQPRLVSTTAVAAGAVTVGLSVALVGGIAGPLACMLLAVPVESYWVSRSRREAAAAFGISLAAMAMAAAFVAAHPASASPWLWLTPLAYAATLALRWGRPGGQAPRAAAVPISLDVDLIDAAVLRLGGSGEVESAGGAGAAMLNVDPALLLGTGFFDRVHVADRVAFLCAVSDARREAGSRRVELRLRRAADPKTGERGSYGLFEMELVRGAGDSRGLWALVRDAGKVEELRGDLARAVEQANATEVAKGRFLATVSHELRTPLNAIIGFSDMLLHPEISGELTTKQTEHVGLIREAGNHLLSVVNAILDVSKIESGSYQIASEPFELKAAVDLCCAMLEPQAASRGVALGAKIPPGLEPVLGDQRAVQQILLNLLSNAIKFTPKGGSVTVNAVPGDGAVRLFVNDTGIGIAADDLAKLGKPFMQVRNDYTRQFQGTGLGLSLVKGLVRLHGGTMSIESAPGLGTTVIIGLPTVNAGSGGPAAEWNAQGEDNGTALRRIA